MSMAMMGKLWAPKRWSSPRPSLPGLSLSWASLQLSWASLPLSWAAGTSSAKVRTTPRCAEELLLLQESGTLKSLRAGSAWEKAGTVRESLVKLRVWQTRIWVSLILLGRRASLQQKGYYNISFKALLAAKVKTV